MGRRLTAQACEKGGDALGLALRLYGDALNGVQHTAAELKLARKTVDMGPEADPLYCTADAYARTRMGLERQSSMGANRSAPMVPCSSSR